MLLRACGATCCGLLRLGLVHRCVLAPCLSCRVCQSPVRLANRFLESCHRGVPDWTAPVPTAASVSAWSESQDRGTLLRPRPQYRAGRGHADDRVRRAWALNATAHDWFCWRAPCGG